MKSRGKHQWETALLKNTSLIAVVLLSTGCDPRGEFIGEYNGTVTVTYSASGQRETQTFNDVSLEIELDDSERDIITIELEQDPCLYEAEVSSSSKFSFNHKTCPAVTDNNGCTLTPRISGGEGEKKGSRLKFGIKGTLDVRCPSGSGSATYEFSFSGTKDD